MHTIDDCPRCLKSFMRHSSDVHLHRTVNYPDYVKVIVICQECDEKEKKLKK